MDPFYREFELTKPVSNYFINQGYKVIKEIRIGYCRADLVAFNEDRVIAIEIKLSDRKKAIIQAKNYQLGADYVYLVFPLMKSYSLLRKSEYTLQKEGIGLLIVNEITCKVSKIIDAKPSKRKFASITLKEIRRSRENIANKFKFY
ncbi:MAG: hypothetical protein JSW06_06180 [Thermoplasmatales archaeon]|nr:MAG: hypothetical protein JSW06_06180 [Thermoplasmatales archaeon]